MRSMRRLRNLKQLSLISSFVNFFLIVRRFREGFLSEMEQNVLVSQIVGSLDLYTSTRVYSIEERKKYNNKNSFY